MARVAVNEPQECRRVSRLKFPTSGVVVSEQFGIPEDRREAALVYYSLIRAYWRLSDAARFGPIGDTERISIEADTIELLSGAAAVVDDLGPHPEELAVSATEALERIFFEARRTSRTWTAWPQDC